MTFIIREARVHMGFTSAMALKMFRSVAQSYIYILCIVGWESRNSKKHFVLSLLMN